MTDIGLSPSRPPDAIGADDLTALATRKLHERPHPGRWVTGAVILAFLGFIIYSFANGQIAWSIVPHYLFNHLILSGLYRTVLITVLSTVIGTALGTLIAVMRMSTNPVASSTGWLYVWVFRGTPELLQLFIWFNLALVFPDVAFPGLFHVQTVKLITPFVAALLSLSINTAAYIAENIRGAILSVDEGQLEAATALSLPKRTTLRRVVLPQAMPALIPAIGNQAIGLLKLSSLASAISYTELLGEAQQIYYVNARPVELLFTIAIWYLAATSVASVLQYYVEKHYGRSARNHRVSVADRLLGSGLSRLLGRTAGEGAA